MYEESGSLAERTGGHYMDQFTYAERATDWRGNNNIAESIFQQLRGALPGPAWIVARPAPAAPRRPSPATSTTCSYDTRVCVADPENSCFFEGWTTGDPTLTVHCGSRIEGIGRPRMEPSFVPGAIDRMIRVSTRASYAAMRLLSNLVGRRYGGSTGTDFYGALSSPAK